MVKYSCTNPDGYLEPRVEKLANGNGADAARAPKTVIDVFRAAVAQHGKERAMALKRGTKEMVEAKPPQKPAVWQIWTWQDYWNDCIRFAKTLVALNISSFEVVNIIGFNSPEWFIANSGSILAGCIAAGIYTTNNPEACEYQVSHSKSQVVVLEDNSQLKKFVQVASKLPSLKHLVIWMEQADPALVAKLPAGIKCYHWEDFLNVGKSTPDKVVEDRMSKVLPGHCSTLIYTSGTTGMPKAVMISHDNVTWTTGIMVDTYFPLDSQDRCTSYLPLSHIAAQLIDLHVPMNLGCCTYFCQPYDMKLGTITDTMKDVEPTFFFGVPRVWEKIQEKMVGMGRGNSFILKALSIWAKMLGTKHSQANQYGKSRIGSAQSFYTLIVAAAIVYFGVMIRNDVLGKGKVPQLAFIAEPAHATAYYSVFAVLAFLYVVFHEGYFLANALVFKTIKARLGLHKSKANFTAAAPISVDTLNYFASLDIPVYEVFGQSECTGPHTVCAPGVWKIGSCGRPMPGTQSRVDPATKELTYRGRHVFMGYMYDPVKTDETIDSDGYLHSGDVGEFDDDEAPRSVLGGPSGFMRITGRIKELIIGPGGENIPPVLIENEMKAEMVALSNAMVIGDKRKYLTMLVSLKCEPDKDTGAPSDALAKDALYVASLVGSTATTVTQALKCPKLAAYIDEGMKKVNARAISQAQNVQKWRLLPVDFSEKSGELTPTLKLKRSVVVDRHAALIEEMYKE